MSIPATPKVDFNKDELQRVSFEKKDKVEVKKPVNAIISNLPASKNDRNCKPSFSGINACIPQNKQNVNKHHHNNSILVYYSKSTLLRS